MKGVPCHRTTGHGESCCEDNPCTNCMIALQLAVTLAGLAYFARHAVGPHEPVLAADMVLIEYGLDEHDIDLHGKWFPND